MGFLLSGWSVPFVQVQTFKNKNSVKVVVSRRPVLTETAGAAVQSVWLVGQHLCLFKSCASLGQRRKRLLRGRPLFWDFPPPAPQSQPFRNILGLGLELGKLSSLS